MPAALLFVFGVANWRAMSIGLRVFRGRGLALASRLVAAGSPVSGGLKACGFESFGFPDAKHANQSPPPSPSTLDPLRTASPGVPGALAHAARLAEGPGQNKA